MTQLVRIKVVLLADPQFPGALFMPAQIPKKTVTPLFRESTPLYWVIQDPRLKKRRRLDFRGKVSLLYSMKRVFLSHENSISNFQTIYENGLNQGAVTTTWPRLREAIDRRFQLPLIEDETVVFSVPNSSKITEFQWVALRNHCSQVCSSIFQRFPTYLIFATFTWPEKKINV